jgi:hypothetical protein
MEHVVSLQVSFVEQIYLLPLWLFIWGNSSFNSSLSKNFWKYIKSRKKDSMGISPLQNLSEEYIIDNKGKQTRPDANKNTVHGFSY